MSGLPTPATRGQTADLLDVAAKLDEIMVDSL
jgi:hypothetical protein